MSRRQEIELKLVVPPETLAAIGAAAGQSFGSGFRVEGDPRCSDTTTVYYDTPGLELARAGLSLRVRRSEGRFIQTLKTPPDSGGSTFSRGEFEWPVESDLPNVALLASETIDGSLPTDLSDLRPVFTSEMKRTRLAVRAAGCNTRIELCLDHGRVNAGQHFQEISEIEAELIDGSSPRPLYALGKELLQGFPEALCHIGTESKAQIGYRLLTGEPPLSRKARDFELPHDVTVVDGLRRILRECTEHFLANQAAALAGDIDGIHQARVATRRLRAALSLFDRFLSEVETARLRAELKWLAGELGNARDWDVLVTRTLPSRDLGRTYQRRAAKQRAAAHARLAAALRSSRCAEIILNLGLLAENEEPSTTGDGATLQAPLSEIGATLLTKVARKARKAGGRRIERLDHDARHRARKKLKRLRYAASFLAPLYRRKRTTRYLGKLEKLQDVLGELNDDAVAENLLGQIGVPEDKRAVAGASYSATAEEQLGKSWKRFRKSEPFWF